MSAPPSSQATGTNGFWVLVTAHWRFFSSLRLTLVLLSLLAGGAVVGTFLPQLPQNPGLTFADLERVYPAWAFRWLALFQVFDLFHSWWFTLAMVLLALNLVACSWPRLLGLRSAMERMPGVPPDAGGVRLEWAGGDSDPTVLATRLGWHLTPPSDSGGWWRAERGRWNRPGFLLVHLGVVIVLLGGAGGQLGGLEGSLTLEPGTEIQVVQLRDTSGGEHRVDLPFALRCRDFRIERFGGGAGAVRDYVSDLEVLDGDRVVQRHRLEVNEPLRLAGFGFYQSSYQHVPALDQAELRIRDVAGDRTLLAAVGDRVAVAPDGTEYRLGNGRQEYRGLGPAVRVETRSPGGRQRAFWVLERYPGFVAANRPGGVGLDLLAYRPGWATVLGVSRDPGTPIVWLGSASLLLGLVLVFSGRHRRLWLRPRPVGGFELVCWAHRGQAGWANELAQRLGDGSVGSPGAGQEET